MSSFFEVDKALSRLCLAGLDPYWNRTLAPVKDPPEVLRGDLSLVAWLLVFEIGGFGCLTPVVGVFFKVLWGEVSLFIWSLGVTAMSFETIEE